VRDTYIIFNHFGSSVSFLKGSRLSECENDVQICFSLFEARRCRKGCGDEGSRLCWWQETNRNWLRWVMRRQVCVARSMRAVLSTYVDKYGDQSIAFNFWGYQMAPKTHTRYAQPLRRKQGRHYYELIFAATRRDPPRLLIFFFRILINVSNSNSKVQHCYCFCLTNAYSFLESGSGLL